MYVYIYEGPAQIFIIIGLPCAVVAGLSPEHGFSRHRTNGRLKQRSSQDFVESCLKSTAADAVLYTSAQGGYYMPRDPSADFAAVFAILHGMGQLDQCRGRAADSMYIGTTSPSA